MRTSLHTRGGCEAGVTLVELLVSMIILGIITTMLVVVWINLQRSAVFAMQADNATSAARDASARIGTEIRAAQPNALPPTPTPTATTTAMPVGQPAITFAGPWEIKFYSPVGSANITTDGTGIGAVHLTRIYLDTTGSTPQKTLYLQRDMNGNASSSSAGGTGFTDSGDKSIVLARNVVNRSYYDINTGAEARTYQLFRYAWRTSDTSPLQWGDNDTEGAITLSTIVGVRARVIIDANIYHTPKYIDTTTTVRLRNTSGS
jgi:prepilin-type N-terminal cleavage/methylation domain-containing protein